MHELWVCKSILDIIRENAIEKKFTRVKKIILELGQLVAIEKDALIFSFNVITEGTVAENAALHIIDIPGEARCESCKKRVPLRRYYDACPVCGSHSLKITQGEEFSVKSMVAE
ncbi:hydrogenase nickel incorporation protein HypA [Legionella rubrilucens]|uniref:Hydrogenase maturation factor HypA n=1 Tax=Legionella rubrilucens TaxID=458 RepID=A0A0W0XXR2_9GAMM|nr:hydrogenase maturation nickel metallochaperone HypA [Legionella rubrilucens]KTD49092.1 hydrogenase nickel incorporation protein HypA [Legionella rubrilucens]